MRVIVVLDWEEVEAARHNAKETGKMQTVRDRNIEAAFNSDGSISVEFVRKLWDEAATDWEEIFMELDNNVEVMVNAPK